MSEAHPLGNLPSLQSVDKCPSGDGSRHSQFYLCFVISFCDHPPQNPNVPSAKVCSCNPGFADSSCNVPVTSLSNANGIATAFDFPGKSWRYFYATVLFTGAATLMSTLMKPALSFSNYQPVLQMTARSSGTSGQAYYGLPGYSDLDPSNFILQVGLIKCIVLEYGLCLDSSCRQMSEAVIKTYLSPPHGITVSATPATPAMLHSVTFLRPIGELPLQHLQLLPSLSSP